MHVNAEGPPMYRAHLAVVELREKALVAREKARRARRVAVRTGVAGEAFGRQAIELDAKAALLERQAEEAMTALANAVVELSPR